MTYNFHHSQNSSYTCSVQYIGEKIRKVEMNFPEVKEISLARFLGCIHADIDETINALAGIGFVLLKEDVPNQVIGTNIPPTVNYCGIWVDEYQRQYSKKYIIREKEARNLKDLALEKNEFSCLVKFFFECTINDVWFAKTKDITTFVNNINEIRRLQSMPKEIIKQKFPNYWTKQEELKYNGTELTAYWTHLRSLGWRKVGTIWEAPENSPAKLSQNLHDKFTLK